MSRMLQEHLRKTAAFHKEAALQHSSAGSHAHALGRLHDGELASHFKALGNAHEVLAKEHADHSADALEMCEKTVGDELNKLVPSDVRVVIPTAPSVVERIYGAEGLTAVPRAGQPPMPQHSPVPLEFEHLVKVEDE